MADRIFWNKLGFDAEVDASEIGANGTRTGTITYAAGKFDNGVNGADGSNYITFASALTTLELCTFDFWFKPNYSSTAAGAKDIINTGFDPVTSWGFYSYYNGSGGIACAIEIPGQYTVYTFPITFASGDLLHLGLVLKSAGAAGSRMRLFKDNVEIEESGIVNDAAWTLGGRNLVIAPVMGTVQGVIDDLVVWDDEKTSFADRNDEGRVSAGPAAATYTKIIKGLQGDADTINDNFRWIGEGNKLPKGGQTLDPTTGVYDLGSTVYNWKDVHVNSISVNNVDYKSWRRVAQVNITSPALRIDFTGLDGDTDVEYMLIWRMVHNGEGLATGTVHMEINGDNSATAYGSQMMYQENTTRTAGRTVSSSLPVGHIDDLGTSPTYFMNYGKGFIYSNTIKHEAYRTFRGSFLSSHLTTAFGTKIERYTWIGGIWGDEPTEDILTTLSFYFDNTASGQFYTGTAIAIYARRA